MLKSHRAAGCSDDVCHMTFPRLRHLLLHRSSKSVAGARRGEKEVISATALRSLAAMHVRVRSSNARPCRARPLLHRLTNAQRLLRLRTRRLCLRQGHRLQHVPNRKRNPKRICASRRILVLRLRTCHGRVFCAAPKVSRRYPNTSVQGGGHPICCRPGLHRDQVLVAIAQSCTTGKATRQARHLHPRTPMRGAQEPARCRF